MVLGERDGLEVVGAEDGGVGGRSADAVDEFYGRGVAVLLG